MPTTTSLTLRWLGTAGVEIEIGGQILAIDPFFTRPPLWKALSRVAPDQEIITRHMRAYSHILVTHSHYDHLLDVGTIARRCGAVVYGSLNTCRILAGEGLPAEQIQLTKPGDELCLGQFNVHVLAGNHIRLPIDRWINGELGNKISFPMRPVDYRMDAVYSYHLSVEGITLLHGEQTAQADVWMFSPYQSRQALAQELSSIRPRLAIPIHWDDFFRPLSEPLRPMLSRPSREHLPLMRMDMAHFKQSLEALQPGLVARIPQALAPFEVW